MNALEVLQPGMALTHAFMPMNVADEQFDSDVLSSCSEDENEGNDANSEGGNIVVDEAIIHESFADPDACVMEPDNCSQAKSKYDDEDGDDMLYKEFLEAMAKNEPINSSGDEDDGDDEDDYKPNMRELRDEEDDYDLDLLPVKRDEVRDLVHGCWQTIAAASSHKKVWAPNGVSIPTSGTTVTSGNTRIAPTADNQQSYDAPQAYYMANVNVGEEDNGCRFFESSGQLPQLPTAASQPAGNQLNYPPQYSTEDSVSTHGNVPASNSAVCGKRGRDDMTPFHFPSTHTTAMEVEVGSESYDKRNEGNEESVERDNDIEEYDHGGQVNKDKDGRKHMIATAVNQLFSGQQPNEVCIDGMPINVMRSLVARQMNMMVQLLFQLLTLSSLQQQRHTNDQQQHFTSPSLVTSMAYNYLYELNRSKEDAIRKAYLTSLNLENVQRSLSRKALLRQEQHSQYTGGGTVESVDVGAGLKTQYRHQGYDPLMHPPPLPLSAVTPPIAFGANSNIIQSQLSTVPSLYLPMCPDDTRSTPGVNRIMTRASILKSTPHVPPQGAQPGAPDTPDSSVSAEVQRLHERRTYSVLDVPILADGLPKVLNCIEKHIHKGRTLTLEALPVLKPLGSDSAVPYVPPEPTHVLGACKIAVSGILSEVLGVQQQEDKGTDKDVADSSSVTTTGPSPSMRIWQCLFPLGDNQGQGASYPLSKPLYVSMTAALTNCNHSSDVFTPAQDDLLLRGIISLGENEWKKVRNDWLPMKEASSLQKRFIQLMTSDDDAVFRRCIRYLRMGRDGKWTHVEDTSLLRGYHVFAEKWSLISTFFLPRRTPKELKQRWNYLQKEFTKLQQGTCKSHNSLTSVSGVPLTLRPGLRSDGSLSCALSLFLRDIEVKHQERLLSQDMLPPVNASDGTATQLSGGSNSSKAKGGKGKSVAKSTQSFKATTGVVVAGGMQGDYGQRSPLQTLHSQQYNGTSQGHQVPGVPKQQYRYDPLYGQSMTADQCGALITSQSVDADAAADTNVRIGRYRQRQEHVASTAGAIMYQPLDDSYFDDDVLVDDAVDDPDPSTSDTIAPLTLSNIESQQQHFKQELRYFAGVDVSSRDYASVLPDVLAAIAAQDAPHQQQTFSASQSSGNASTSTSMMSDLRQNPVTKHLQSPDEGVEGVAAEDRPKKRKVEGNAVCIKKGKVSDYSDANDHNDMHSGSQMTERVEDGDQSVDGYPVTFPSTHSPARDTSQLAHSSLAHANISFMLEELCGEGEWRF